MAPCRLAFNQAQSLLTDAADTLAPLIRTALDLWLQATDELPELPQHPYAAAATGLVQTALQQVPRPMQLHDPRQVAWLQKHLPGISAAMYDNVSRRLDITKRMGILQSLASSSKPPDSAQMLGQLVSERNTHLWLQVLSSTLCLVLSVEALCSQLSWPAQARDTQRCRSKQQHQLEQGDEFISRVARSLNHNQDMWADVVLRMVQIQIQIDGQTRRVFTGLQGTGMPKMEAPIDLLRLVHNVYMLVGKASLIWLLMVKQLPPSHSGIYRFFVRVDWKGLFHFRELNYRFDATLKHTLNELFVSTEMLAQFCKQCPRLARHLLHYIGWTADHVHTLGLSVAKQQGVLAFLRDVDLDTNADAEAPKGLDTYTSGWAAASNNSTTSSMQGFGHDSVGQSTADKAAAAAAAAGDRDGLDDMQSLLQMMYGCTVKEGGVGA